MRGPSAIRVNRAGRPGDPETRMGGVVSAGAESAPNSWSYTLTSTCTHSTPRKFLQRLEREVEPDRKLLPDERRRGAEHAKRAYMLRPPQPRRPDLRI